MPKFRRTWLLNFKTDASRNTISYSFTALITLNIAFKEYNQLTACHVLVFGMCCMHTDTHTWSYRTQKLWSSACRTFQPKAGQPETMWVSFSSAVECLWWHKICPYLLLTHSLTHCMEQSRSLRSSPVLQLINKFPASYETRRLITAFTRPNFLKVHLKISSCHLLLGFPSSLFPSGVPTKTLYSFILKHNYFHMIRLKKCTNLTTLPKICRHCAAWPIHSDMNSVLSSDVTWRGLLSTF
jgi:hypothetical protein